MGCPCIRRIVREFQGRLVRDHCNDLRCTTLTPFNAIVDGLRNGVLPSFVDAVLARSKKIKETTSMRKQMEDDKAMHKRELVCWHLVSDEKMLCRIPNKVNSFEGFRKKKRCKVKDCDVEIIVKMHRLHCVNTKELQEEIGNKKQDKKTNVCALQLGTQSGRLQMLVK